MILRNGRQIMGHLGSILEYYPEVLAENERLKLKLEATQRLLAKALYKLGELQDVVNARHEAEAKLEALHRERDAKQALYRAPAHNETLH